jgi:MFS transporter, PPP family, 3-phenylpropionic acid transporter
MLKSLPQSSERAAVYQIAALQFVTFAARGISWPFVNLYLVSVGFSGTQIGLLASISALVQLVATPLLHAIADRTGRHRPLYIGLLIGNACACLGLVVFAANPLLLGGMILLRDLTDMAGAVLLSQLTITWLERQQRQIFGKLRAWGSLGWGVATMISGRMIAIGGYPLLFILSAVFNVAVLPVVKVLPTRTNELHERAPTHPARPLGLSILLASMFLFYAGSLAYFAFAFIYFKQDLGASNEMLGILSSVAALSEIPAMVLIDRLLRRADIRATLVVGMLGQGALFFAFSRLTGPALLIPLMLVRGTFYALHLVSLTLLVARISQPASVATNQALAQVTIPSLAVLLTGSLSGWLFDHVGGRVLLELAALMAVLSVILLVAARRQLTGREEQAHGVS